MKRLRIALGVMLVAVAVNARAATYYVDQTAGSDGNNGTTGFTGAFNVNLAPNTTGLAVQPGSPAVDHGVALNTAYGTSINSVGRPAAGGWDIGAYEAGGSLTAPRPPTSVRIIP